MAELLTAAQSVRNRKEDEDGESLLTALQSRTLSAATKGDAEPVYDDRAARQLTQPTTSSIPTRPLESQHSGSTDGPGPHANRAPLAGRAGDPTTALHMLRSCPDIDTLVEILQQLRDGTFSEPFELDVPGPLQAQIINTLMAEIVTNFWPTMEITESDLLIRCLENVAGVNAVVARLRLLTSQKDSTESIGDVLDVIHRLFRKVDLITSIRERMRSSVPDRNKQKMSWKELVSLFGSGKVVAVVAQAGDALKDPSKPAKGHFDWLADGAAYCAWLGRSIASIVHGQQCIDEPSGVADAALLLAKGLHIGYSGQLLEGFLRAEHRPGHDVNTSEEMTTLLRSLPAHSKRTFVEHLLRWLSTTITPDASSQRSLISCHNIPAVAGLITIIAQDQSMLQHLQSHLTDPALSSFLSQPVRRASLAVLATIAEGDILEPFLEKLISAFSSKLFVAHAPVAQQESLAQTILVTAGYVYRKAPLSLLMTARSSGHMQGVSNRLDSSNARARWLGMAVGTALSKLVDKPGSQMEFGTEEMRSDDAIWYMDLVNVNHSIGTLESFVTLVQASEQAQEVVKSALKCERPKNKPTTINGKPFFGPPRPPAPVETHIVGERFTEILDEESDDDVDLKPYAKPDSDPEDSDEDATLVNRKKFRAPVYIRDLMAGLREDKEFDRFTLALKTAAPLIRRKAGFGKEVTDHAEELAGMLCNLQDPFDTDDFDELRLQALVAVLLSDHKVIAPLLSRQAFTEGYSIAQRCVILSALGLGGRELAGFRIEDEDYNPKLSNTEFPSKKLPPRLDVLYSSSLNRFTQRLEAASNSTEHQMIQPMALQAADQSTAHLNAVKVRSFSSRMDIERARTKRKTPANELAKCFGERFFFPLANRYQQEISAYGFGSIYASAPFVLVTFVKTLALLLHASGPATLGLPQISAELWELLLSLRIQAIGDISVLQALLFALLTLLEINTDKQRIAHEHAKQLMETQRWVDMVFERMGSSGLIDEDDGKSDEAKVKTLAAGVLMKCREIIEAYQKQLIGYDFG